MSDSPLIWNISESIPIDLFVADPNTSKGLIGQAGFITLTIQRFSDSKYWTGSAWSSTLTALSFSEVDSTNQPGRYLYTLSAIANSSANKYITHASISNPPIIEGDSYEIHASRDLVVDVYDIIPEA
ncbi:MAG: hypothetical protein WC523_00630 [Patescibacteria group bacterium]